MTGNVLPILRSVLVQRYTQIKQSLSIQLGSPDLAGDTLHEIWLRLQRDSHLSGPVLNPQAYLVRMGVNLAIDIRRSQSRMLSAEDVQELMAVMPDPAPGPAQVAEARSELEALKAALDEMPARRREILQRFLDREAIYATPRMHALLEARARENLRRSIAG